MQTQETKSAVDLISAMQLSAKLTRLLVHEL